MSEATQTIEQTFNKTDFGHLVYEKRKLLIALVVAALVLITGFLVWKQTQHSRALNQSVQVFEFQSGVWADVKADKTSIPELLKAYNALDEGVRQSSVMLPVVLEMGKFLYDKGELASAEEVLSKALRDEGHPIGLFFVNMQRAVVLEKMGKLDEAIGVLEPLAKMKDGLMPAKVSLELGRLYLEKGEKGKAQSQFNSILDSYPNDEQAKMAKLYLAQLAK